MCIIPFLACFCFAHFIKIVIQYLKNVSNVICYMIFVDTYSLLLLLVALVNSYFTFTVQKTVCIFMLERKTARQNGITRKHIYCHFTGLCLPPTCKGPSVALTLLIYEAYNEIITVCIHWPSKE